MGKSLERIKIVVIWVTIPCSFVDGYSLNFYSRENLKKFLEKRPLGRRRMIWKVSFREMG
jgi:hypothetical protein